MKKYTWDEIYQRADGCCFGEDNLKAKDNARENVRWLALEFGEDDLEKAECPEDEVDYYCNKYNILFDENGHIVECSTLNIVVINCDGKYVGYKWISKEAFVKDMESDNENIPMLDDMLEEVVTQDNELLERWVNTGGITVDDLLEECKRELYRNDNFRTGGNSEYYKKDEI